MRLKAWQKLFFVQFALIMGIIALVSAIYLTTSAFAGSSISAAVAQVDTGGLALGAGLAIGLAGLGAGIGLGNAASAAIGAISERPEVFGRTIIFAALIEGIAIFGFVVAAMIIFILAAA